jgi:HEAT repeat protein
VRRRPPGGIAALDSLSRRFCGFGLNGVVAEQATALRALAQIGGRDAARTIARIIADGVVADPGLPTALQAAADLHSDLPQDIALRLLRHANPAVRAPAALLAPARPDITAILLDLLHDLNAGVADAAALSLARTGRTEARPRLLHLLHTAPAADIIEAIAEIADETCIVALNRAARARPEWRPHIIDALETIGSDLALRVAASLE